MKRLTRYCSLLLCFLLLSIAFSVSASAESVEVKNYNVRHDYYFSQNGTYVPSGHYLIFYPNNGEIEKSEKTHSSEFSRSELENNFYVHSIYNIAYDNNEVILNANKSYNISFNNVYFSALFQEYLSYENIKNTYVRNPIPQYVTFHFNDGTSAQITNNFTVVGANNSATTNISLSYTPKKDVVKITLNLKSNVADQINFSGYYPFIVTTYCGEFEGDGKYQFALEVESQEAGLLKGIIEWLKGIKDGITNLFNSIAELPSKIWSFIENGLKSLFVPDDDFIINFKNDMDAMLSEKLGAVYQVVNILTESWDSITANDQQNTITIPETTISLPQNNKFSFGGNNVQIVPSGFEWLADIIKTVVGIVCTILFVNGLRKKYDEVMGVEQ